MTKTKIFKTSCLLLISMFSISNANAYFYETESTFEVFNPRILITKNNIGYATGKKCKKCEILKFIVNSKTKAFNLRGEQVDLQDANNWSGKAALYSYEIKTNKLMVIREEKEVIE